MDTLRLTTFFRPPKLIFVVEDAAQTTRAIEVCTVLWGGIYNEICPAQDPALSDRIKNADFIIRCGDTAALPKDLEDRILPFQDLIINTGRTKGLLFLDTIGIYLHLKEREIKAVLPPTAARTLLEQFRFGTFSTSAPRQYERAYRDLLKPEDFNHNPKQPALDNSGPYFPIEITALDLSFKWGRGQYESSNIYLIGSSDDFADIALAWTLRSRGHKIYFIDRANATADIADACTWSTAKNHPSFSGEMKSKFGTPNPSIISTRDPEGDKTLLESFSNALKVHHTVKTTPFRFHTKKTHAYYVGTKNHNQMGFIKDRNLTFELDFPPYADDKSSFSEKIGICFELPTVYGQEKNDYIQQVPPVKDPERCLLTGAGRRDGVRIHGNVVTSFENLFGNTQTVWLNSPWEFWRIHFWIKKLEMRPSGAGHNLRNIIDNYGGLDPGCRILKLPALQRLLKLLQNDQSVTQSKLWQNVNRLLSDTNQDLGLRYINKQNFISELCQRGFLRQGYQLRCDKCQNSSWYGLNDINDEWKCKYCGNRARVPHLSNEKLEFKINGLLQLKGGAQGALTSLLTLWRFAHLRHPGEMTYIPSFELCKQGETTSLLECDLLLTMGGRFDDSSQIVLVESKSENNLSLGDIEKIQQLEDIIGTPCYKCFAANKPAFTTEEVQILKNLYNKDPKIILLTSQELTPYELWDVFPNFRDKYVSSLEALSMATVQKHLSPDELVDIRSY